MSAGDILRSRQALASGVGMTTRRNQVLPFAALATTIPARVGKYDPGSPPVIIETPVCLSSHWWTQQYSGSWMDHTAWHAASDTVVSSDGIVRLQVKWPRRTTFEAGRPSLSFGPIHINFSAPATAAYAEPAAGGSDIQILESAHSTREWHPKQTARLYPQRLLACVQRLKAIKLNQGAYSFFWNFKTDGDSGVTGSSPCCLNRTGNETILTDREFANDGTAQPRKRLKRFRLVTDSGLGEVRLTLAPWGLLPATTNKHTALLNNVAGADEANSGNCTDLSKLLSVGQPYHGLCTRTGIRTPDSSAAVATPIGYSSPSNGHTRYFKHPSAPGTPAAGLLPPDYASAGYEFRDDVILSNHGRYSPTSSGELSSTQWLHVGDDGLVRILGAVRVSGDNSSDTFEIRNYGEFTLDVAPVSLGVLATVTITTTDAHANSVTATGSQKRTYTGSTDYQYYSGGVSSGAVQHSVTKIKTNDIWRVQASPDGRQIALMRGFFESFFGGSGITRYGDYDTGFCRSGAILTVATVDISGALAVSAPTDVFQWANSTIYDGLVETRINHVGFNVVAGKWRQWGTGTATYSGGGGTETDCLGFTYKSDGSLHLWTVERDFTTPPDYADTAHNSGFDTGVPSTDPQPAPTIVEGSVYFTTSVVGSMLMPNMGHPGDRLTGLTGSYLNAMAIRLTNNVLQAYVLWVGGSTSYELLTPVAMYGLSAVFPVYYGASFIRYLSYNPKTHALMGNGSITGAISWI